MIGSNRVRIPTLGEQPGDDSISSGRVSYGLLRGRRIPEGCLQNRVVRSDPDALVQRQSEHDLVEVSVGENTRHTFPHR
jgi:hypothetical protein